MIAALRDYRRIARVTTVQRDSRLATMMRWVAVLCVIGFVIGSAIAIARDRFMLGATCRIAVALASMWLAIVWATLFVPGAVLLNSAANARLVPRQRRRLVQMTVVGWLASVLVFGVVFDSWRVLPLVGMYLVGMPLMLTGRPQLGSLVVLPCFWPMLSASVLPPALVASVVSVPGVLALCALTLALGAYGVRLLYPAGGDAHLDSRAAVVKRIQRASTGAALGDGSPGEVRGPAARGVLRLYGWALRRDCRRAEPGPMLMHALGPAAHVSAWLGAMTVIPAVVVGLRLLAALNVDGKLHAFLENAGNVGLAVLALLLTLTTAQFGQQLRRTGGEQALLRLTPLAGDAALLNRRLATQLLKGSLLNWGAMTASMLAATLIVGGDGALMLRECALCCLAGQVALVGLLGDYARDEGWNAMQVLGTVLLAGAVGGAAFGLAWLLRTSPWPWMIVIALVGGALQVRIGWRRMLAAPPAFPAGRLA